MKKTITILCIFALLLSLSACGKARSLENYSVGEYNGGWSVLYTDEDGVEEIAALGQSRQPLAIEKGRIYFTDSGALVSVDTDGGDRQETVITGMSDSAIIRLVDEENFYCMADSAASTCWRISKTDSSDHEEMTIPYALRPTDYEALEAQIRAAVAAVDDQIRVRSALVQLDANGSLLSLELELFSYIGVEKTMAFWNTGSVSVTVTAFEATAVYNDEHIPLSLAESTIERLIPLENFLAALKSADTARIAANNAAGSPEGFRLAYLVEEYEDCADEHEAALTVVDRTGAAAAADDDQRRFVLMQLGGGEALLTDSRGDALSHPVAVQLG